MHRGTIRALRNQARANARTLCASAYAQQGQECEGAHEAALARTSFRAMAPTERNSATAIWWIRNMSSRYVKNLRRTSHMELKGCQERWRRGFQNKF